MVKNNGHNNDPYKLYLMYRALIEEFYANTFVEDVVVVGPEKILTAWVRFSSKDSNPQDVAADVVSLADENKIELVIFGVGRSNYMCYSAPLHQFFCIRKHGPFIPTLAEVERLIVPKARVVSKIKNLFLEDKRRKLVHEDNQNEISQSQTDNSAQ